jgi:hypothetical protein
MAAGYYDALTDTESELNREVPVNEDHKCTWCKLGNATLYRADPFMAEIHDTIEMKYYHEDCYFEHAEEI